MTTLLGSSDQTELTRTERRRLATRSSLLDAVIELLVEQQDSRLSSTDIAERADVAVGTFYNHFVSVEEAIEEAFAPLGEAIEMLVSELIEGHDLATELGRVVGSFLWWLSGKPEVWRATRVAGWAVPPQYEFEMARRLRDGGYLSAETDEELASAAHLACNSLTVLIDAVDESHLTEDQVAAGVRIVTSALMDDPDDVERAVDAARACLGCRGSNVAERPCGT